ncbi:MAG: hypothetical protein AB1546_14000 [bacterium]
MFLTSRAYGVLEGERGASDVVKEENQPEFSKLFTIVIENKKDGKVIVKGDEETVVGRDYLIAPNIKDDEEKIIGTVLSAAGTVNKQGYTASGWARAGTVAATAVNAIHIKVAQSGEKGVLFSILPKEFYEKPKDYKSYYSSSSSIITDIPAGTLMFGGGFSPFIGNKVFLLKDGERIPIPENYSPVEGDVIEVSVEQPLPLPSQIEFENRFGGFIRLRYVNGEEKVIGQVLKPVAGVGRFDGSLYADVGRIRANHTGVICVSTSPVGQIGGFQIIPENHGMSAEMKFARLLTQWMVVGPPAVDDPSTEGTAPLFSYFIRPIYFPIDERGRTLEEMLDMYIVQVRKSNGEWERMPTVTGRVDDALLSVTHIRILFPIEADFLRQ